MQYFKREVNNSWHNEGTSASRYLLWVARKFKRYAARLQASLDRLTSA